MSLKNCNFCGFNILKQSSRSVTLLLNMTFNCSQANFLGVPWGGETEEIKLVKLNMDDSEALLGVQA